MKEKEAKDLEKKYGKKKAREIAEQHFQEKIEDIQRQEDMEERQKNEILRRNREMLIKAEMRADQPIDDSAVVDDMFGFLEDQKDTVSESQAPSAFRDLPAPKVSFVLSHTDFCHHMTRKLDELDELILMIMHIICSIYRRRSMYPEKCIDLNVASYFF